MASSLESMQFALANNLNCCLSICHSKKLLEQIDVTPSLYSTLRLQYKNLGLNLGVLLTFLIADDTSAVHLDSSWVAPNLELNFQGGQTGAKSFLDKIVKVIDPSIIVMANIYNSDTLKYTQMEFLSRIFKL